MPWNISYFAASVTAGAGNGVPAGVFLPLANLPGISPASELSEAIREKKVALSVANAVFTGLTANTGKLGLSCTKPAPVGANTDRLNQTFTFTVEFLANHAANTLSMLPIPSGGLGAVTLVSLFPQAAIVAAGAALSGAGVVVPNTVISAAGGNTLANLATDDARLWITALYQSMIQNLDPANSLIDANRSAPLGLAFPDTYTGSNALTGINVSDLPLRSLFSITYSLTLQLALNQTNQTFDVVS